MISKSTLTFLKQLKDNNSSEWVNDHRSEYTFALEDFRVFNEQLISAIGKFDPKIARTDLQAKDCIPRLNRDLRFAKDKSPYKTYLYSIIQDQGRKSGKAGYAVVVDPGNCCITCGAFQPDPQRLKELRTEIEYNFDQWRKITEDKEFLAAFPDGIISQASLQKVPKGFDPESPAQEFLKMKGFFVKMDLTESFLQSKQAIEQIATKYSSCNKLLDFLNK